MTDPDAFDDDRLESLLGRSLQGLSFDDGDEPVPDRVTQGSLWVHDFLFADAALAELVSDTDAAAPAGVRSSGSVRSLSYEAPEHFVDIEVVPGPASSRSLVGEISPPVIGRVRVVVAGVDREVDIDERGWFHVEGLRAGSALVMIDGPELRLRLDPIVI